MAGYSYSYISTSSLATPLAILSHIQPLSLVPAKRLVPKALLRLLINRCCDDLDANHHFLTAVEVTEHDLDLGLQGQCCRRTLFMTI